MMTNNGKVALLVAVVFVLGVAGYTAVKRNPPIIAGAR